VISIITRKYIYIVLLIGFCIGSQRLNRVPTDLLSPGRSDTRTNDFRNEEELLNFIESTMETNFIPGLSISIAKGGSIVWNEHFGYANINENILVDENTKFILSSASKTITATALMQLFQQDLFMLDDDVDNYLPFDVSHPDYPEIPITFKMLLSHTSGIKDNWGFMPFYDGDSPLELSYYLSQYFSPLGEFYDNNLNFTDHEPGTGFRYSNIGAALVGLLVEEISNQSFNEYCIENIFEPLGMSDAYWFLSEIENLNEVASPHQFADGSTDSLIVLENYGYSDYPAGQLRTTSYNLAKFMNLFINDGIFDDVEILSPETIELMKTIHYPNVAYDQGLMWYYKTLNNRTLFGHGGSDKGSLTEMFISFPDTVGVILLSNSRNHEGMAQIENAVFNFAVDTDFTTLRELWFVSTEGSDETGDGYELNPFATIQKGIDTASDRDTVFVSAGTYVENINFIGKNIVLIGEDKETTIIDGNEEGSVVKFENGEDENAMIMGFTLRNGLGSDLYFVFDAPTPTGLDTSIVSCFGGGIQFKNSSPKIEDLIIMNNKATFGAGLGLWSSNPHIFNVLISDNYSFSSSLGELTYGSGLFLYSSSPQINYSVITDNNGCQIGGGLSAQVNSSPTISHSNFVNNSATSGNEIFTGLGDSTIFSNGSGIVTITNSIIYNDIVFDDTDAPPEYEGDIVGSPNITYSFVSDGYEGEGNLNSIPLFCDQDNGDLTLAANSPLLGSGENGSNIGAFGVGCDPITTSLEYGGVVPKEFILYQNYPNPFNPITLLKYDLPEDGLVDVTIYDMMGRVVKTLVNGSQTAGFKSVQWNATNDRNEPVSAGLYLYTIQAGEFRQTKKMVLLK